MDEKRRHELAMQDAEGESIENLEAAAKILDEAQELAAERQLYEWRRGLASGFTTKLFEVIAHADSQNRRRLAKGFPREVRVYERYHGEEGYWQKVVWKFEFLKERR